MIISERAGQEVTEYVALLEEALPLLGVTIDSAHLDGFVCGEAYISAVDVLSMCAAKGIGLSEEALREIRLDAEASLDDDWDPDRHAAHKAMEYIAIIRANRAS